MRTEYSFALLLALAAAAAAQTTVNLRSQGRDVDFSAAIETKPFKAGTTLPPTCTTGSAFFKTNAAAGQNIYLCTATNTWSQVAAQGGGGGGSLPDMTGFTDGVLSTDGTSAAWQLLAGDASGAPQNITVTRLRGITVSSAAPADGQSLVYDAANTRYAPRTTLTSLQASTGLICATSISTATCRTDDAVVPYYIAGTGTPAYSCQAGRDFYTDTAARDFYFCSADNKWQLLSKRQLNARTTTDELTATGTFGGTTAIPANTLTAGSVAEISWSGVVSATTNDMTFALAPRLGSTPLSDAPVTTGILTGSVSLPWQVNASCIVLTTGVAGTMECTGSMAWSESATAHSHVLYLSTATRPVDTTAAADWRLVLTSIGGTGTLTATQRYMKVEVR